jgi:hypothetical protein
MTLVFIVQVTSYVDDPKDLMTFLNSMFAISCYSKTRNYQHLHKVEGKWGIVYIPIPKEKWYIFQEHKAFTHIFSFFCPF